MRKHANSEIFIKFNNVYIYIYPVIFKGQRLICSNGACAQSLLETGHSNEFPFKIKYNLRLKFILKS